MVDGVIRGEEHAGGEIAMVVRATEAEIDVVRTDPRRCDSGVQRRCASRRCTTESGYEGCYVLLSEEGKMLVLSFWSSDETARASRLSGFYEAQVEKFSDLVVYRQAPGREAYDVVIAEAPQEAIALGAVDARALRDPRSTRCSRSWRSRSASPLGSRR